MDEIIRVLRASSTTAALKEFPWESSLVKANPFYPQFMQVASLQGVAANTEDRLKELKAYLARTGKAQTGTAQTGTDKSTVDSLCDLEQWSLTSILNDDAPSKSTTIKMRVFDYSKGTGGTTHDFQFAHNEGKLYGDPNNIRSLLEESVRSFRRFKI